MATTACIKVVSIHDPNGVVVSAEFGRSISRQDCCILKAAISPEYRHCPGRDVREHWPDQIDPDWSGATRIPA